MKTPFTTLAFATLVALAPAQNTNQDAPRAHNILEFESGATIHISYRQFTIAKGETFKALSSGKAPASSVSFLNDQYIPGVLDGRMSINANATLGEVELEAGKYRFSFSIDEDAIWNLDIYADTGKKSDAELWNATKGWWTQEEKIAAIAIDTKENDDGTVERLSIAPMANAESNKPTGNVRIDFGPATARVSFKLGKPASKLGKPAKTKTVEASSKGSK